MTAPATVYLRSKRGEPIGPLPVANVAQLLAGGVIDLDTPISADGLLFRALQDSGSVREAVEALDSGAPERKRWQEEAAKLQDFEKRFSSASYYELLEISEDETDENARKAYMKLAKLFHPDAAGVGAPESIVERRSALFALVQEAYDSVGETAKRERYNTILNAGGRRMADEQRIIEAILQADHLLTTALQHAQGGRTSAAIKALEEAIGLRPGDPELEAHLAYNRFAAGADTGREHAQQTAQAIDQVLRAHGRPIASVTILLARLHKAAGNATTAKRLYAQVLEQNPSDAEANSELRVAEQRETRKTGKPAEKPKKKGLFRRS